MVQFKFYGWMNAWVSIALSIVMLFLLGQLPSVVNFLLPILEGFLIAMLLSYLVPVGKLAGVLKKRIAIPEQLLLLGLTAIMNVTCITFILQFQANPVTTSNLILWAKALPILYLTAFITSLLAFRCYPFASELK